MDRSSASDIHRESPHPLEATFKTSATAFFTSDIMIAADVIYDTLAIDSLVALVKLFLLQSASKREAVFALTKRNLASFGQFLARLEKHMILCDWLAKGDDCEALPHVFACNFAQSRDDVRIARLTLST